MSKTINPIQKISDQYADCYIAYARKSTDDADNQKNSIEHQELEIRKYIERQGIQIAPLTIDAFCTSGFITEHHSGYKEDADFKTNPDGTISISVERPKFLMLVNLLRQKKLKGVVSLCWDRFSRNEADDMLTKKLIKQGVDVRFVQVTYDQGSAGALHMDIDGMFSRHYSRTISEKVRNTNKKLRSEGKCTYTPPLGYLSEGSDRKLFDPERAPLVKRLFIMYATGEWSYTTLAAWANRNGLTTRPVRRNRTSSERLKGVELKDIPKVSRPITASTIWHILSNPFYIGKIVHKGELFDSTVHQPLIDLATYYKVQAVLRQKSVSIHYPHLAFYTYRGRIRCGVCGRVYSPYTKKGISYYRSRCKEDCTNKVKNVNDKFITEKLKEIISRIHFAEEELQAIEAYTSKHLDAVAERRSAEVDNVRLQRDKALENLEFLAKDKVYLLRTGVFTVEQILEEEAKLKASIAEYDEKISDLSVSAKAMLDYIVSFSELVRQMAIYFEHGLDTEKRDITVQVFSELFIDSGEFKYQAREGYDALLRRFDASSNLSCGEDYIVHEGERIYHSLQNERPFIEALTKHSLLLGRS